MTPETITIDGTEYRLEPVEEKPLQPFNLTGPEGDTLRFEPAYDHKDKRCAFIGSDLAEGGSWLTPDEARRVAEYLTHLADEHDGGQS